jgi:hypothetical protein
MLEIQVKQDMFLERLSPRYYLHNVKFDGIKTKKNFHHRNLRLSDGCVG